jgi:hypothetical protein
VRLHVIKMRFQAVTRRLRHVFALPFWLFIRNRMAVLDHAAGADGFERKW